MTDVCADIECTDVDSSTLPTSDEAVADHLRRVLDATGGRFAGPREATSLAGLNPSTRRSKLKKLGLARIPPDHGCVQKRQAEDGAKLSKF